MDYIRVYQENNTNYIPTAKNTNQIFYPNPIISQLTINTENTYEKNVAVQIFAADGNLVFANTYSVVKNVIYISDLDDLNRRDYVLSYTLGNKNVRFKIVK